MSLEDIKARADAATPGPWKALGTGVAGGDHWYICDDGESLASIHANDGENEDQRQPDAEFIAHARTDIPKLLAALEAVEAEATALDGLSSEVVGEDLRSGLRLAARGIRKVITEALA